jgi:hypothetical protein
LDALELLFTYCQTDSVPRTAVKEQNFSALVIINPTSKVQQAVKNWHGYRSLLQSSLCVDAEDIAHVFLSLVDEHILYSISRANLPIALLSLK